MLLPLQALAGGSAGLWGAEGSPWSLRDSGRVTAGEGAAEARPEARGEEDWRACVAEILEAEARYGIPENYLLAIALTESGRRTEGGSVAPWPWTVNVEGEGRFFRRQSEALAWVREKQRQGSTSIDIGCMQVNLRWHPQAFRNLEEGFSPRANVAYAARLLVSLRQSAGSWREAIGRYHSYTPSLKEAYSERVENNRRYVAAVKQEAGEAGGQILLAQAPRENALAPLWEMAGPAPEGPSLSWSSWLASARAEGVSNLYGEGIVRPLIPHYEVAALDKD